MSRYMGKEYDLINELGPRNWIDSLAGEAVVLGQVNNDPELTVLGTELAKLISEVHYDCDSFFLVEAAAVGLEKIIEAKKKYKKAVLFIDEVFEGKKDHKLSDKWEYDFIMADGRYQINMILPIYDGNSLTDDRKHDAEELVRICYGDPSFGSYTKTEEIVDYTTQVFKITKYFDENGKMIRRIVDHDHEGGMFRGWMEIFYFDDFSTAMRAWRAAKDIVTSNRKK